MKFRSFFSILVAGAITIFLTGIVGLGWITTHSSINLLKGGVNQFPVGATFIPKQAPGMVSLLTNPEKLSGLRQVTLPLKDRQGDRQKWQQWSKDLVGKIGFDYQKDFKPWLGNEITFAITSLDYDRNPKNGAQPGYILAMETRDTKLAQKSLRDFYSDRGAEPKAHRNNISLEQYKGANIISINTKDVWNSVVAGNFVLFSNYPQILKEAINQAQAVDLNLERSEYYQTAFNNMNQPHIGVGYGDILALSAWLDKSVAFSPSNSRQTLGISLSIKGSDLAAQTALIESDTLDDSFNKSFLNNPELQQILASLPFDDRDLAYIDIKSQKSLLEDKIPLYKVTKLAVQSLFPYLKAIVIQNQGKQDNISRANILFKLDS